MGAEPGSALPWDGTWFGGVQEQGASHAGTTPIIFFLSPLPRKGTLAEGCNAKGQPRLRLVLLQEVTAHKNRTVLVCSAKETALLLQRPPRVAAFQPGAWEFAGTA